MYVIFNQTLQLQPINTRDFFFIHVSLASVRKIWFLECQIANTPILAIFLENSVIMLCIPVCHQERGPHPDSSVPSRSGTPLFLCTEYAVVASCVFHVSIPPLPTIPNNRYIQICSFSIKIINTVKYIHMCDGQTSSFVGAR